MSIVIITGGAGGVGQEVVRLLSERGDRVWLTYNRSEERARDLIAKASGSPGLVNARQVNLEAAVETERFVKEVLSIMILSVVRMEILILIRFWDRQTRSVLVW